MADSRRLNRALQQMNDFVKDTVASNTSLAIARGEIMGATPQGVDIDKLVMVIKASIDQAFVQSSRSIEQAAAAEDPKASPAKKKSSGS